MKQLRRQRPFFREGVLNEHNPFKRQELLKRANSDHIDAISDLNLQWVNEENPRSAVDLKQTQKV